MNRVMTSVVAVLAFLGLAACTVATDDAPRDIEQGTVVPRTAPGEVAQAAVGTGRIFLTVPGVAGEPTRLRSVARDVGDEPADVVAALLAGPNTDEFTDQLRTAIPEGMQVTSVLRRAGGVVELDVSDDIQQLSSEAQVLALAQIVYSLTDVSGVRAVRVKVNGASVQWRDGSGALTTGPLTVFDFPGLEPSAQPAYPAVPSDHATVTTPDTATTTTD